MADKVSTKSPIQVRRDEEKEERRQQIIDAAERVITKKGWEGTNFGEVAKVARLSRSLVYFYFPERDDLFHAVCERALGELEKRFRKARAAHKTGIEQIMAIGHAYYEFSYEEPLYFSLISQFQAHKNVADGSDTKKPVQDEGQVCLGLVAETIAVGQADGSIRRSIGDPALGSVAVWAFTHGLIQIAAQEEDMLRRFFKTSPKYVVEHGLKLIHGMFTTV